ncbi:hypothetical protein K2P56_04000 [Patescibacteria group bacterium]|nr:hypothetical protein [Patescibacteria group bacterium]
MANVTHHEGYHDERPHGHPIRNTVLGGMGFLAALTGGMQAGSYIERNGGDVPTATRNFLAGVNDRARGNARVTVAPTDEAALLTPEPLQVARRDPPSGIQSAGQHRGEPAYRITRTDERGRTVVLEFTRSTDPGYQQGADERRFNLPADADIYYWYYPPRQSE